jgi:hypothetical protein
MVDRHLLQAYRVLDRRAKIAQSGGFQAGLHDCEFIHIKSKLNITDLGPVP